MSAVTVWLPYYRLEGAIKLLTAVASLTTVYLLWSLMPAILSLPTRDELERVNRDLAREVDERRAAEAESARLRSELEARVSERTAALTASEARFRDLADAMPQIVWVTNAAGEIEYFNRRWTEYTGYSVTGINNPDLGLRALHPDDRDRTTAGWREAVRVSRPFEIEARLRDRDGHHRWFLIRGVPQLADDGSVLHWFGTNTDVDDHRRATESLERTLADLKSEMEKRREVEEQLLQAQKMEAIGRLAGGVAHDFNNLLTAILGYNEMLREELRGNEIASSYADEVRHAAERATGLTRQLLAFSRRQIVQARVLDLNQVISHLDRMFRRIIGEDIVFETRLSPNLACVRADPSHIDQVILNLVVNSRDAMPRGGTLIIETANIELSETYAERHIEVQPGKYVMLAVSDTGVGMDASTRARIFEPFFTTKEKGTGTGLGLSIVYGIVKQSGGEIVVYSEPGIGTSFKVYFPAVTDNADEQETQDVAAPVRPGATILLVEDEPQVRSLARAMLSREGYTVLEAESTEDARRIVLERGESIDLLLTDVVMPQMGGAELARIIRREHPNIRVLYMSGYTDAGIVQHGIMHPDTPFLQKPFSAAALRAKLAEVLRN